MLQRCSGLLVFPAQIRLVRAALERCRCTVNSQVAARQYSEQPSKSWRPEEVEKWELGRRRLAAMMGVEEDKFSEGEIEAALQYLLPTRLSARDSQPFMKHPSQVFDKRKEAASDASGRPLEPGFYTGYPAYHNLIYEVYQKRQQLEGEGARGGEGEGEGAHKFWVKKKVMANILAEEISDKQYLELVSRLTELSRHPKASSISDFLDQFRRTHFASSSSSSRPTQLSSSGQIRSVGRRKSSVAVVYLTPGGGGVTVNSDPLLSYFPLTEHRQQVLFPLVLTEMLGGVSVTAQVRGGGKTGQAGAIRLAVSKALTGLPGEHHSLLEGAGLLVRDPRSVERKKPGQKKARKKFAWVKR